MGSRAKACSVAVGGALAVWVGAAGCVPPEADEAPWRHAASLPARDAGPVEYAVPPPPFSKATIFPCSDCHIDIELNTERRELETHTKLAQGLNHGPRERWCFDCHNPKDRDKLRLAGDVLVPFEESYRLCGQCHGDKYRDWKAGVHGKRTGSWNGEKQYLLCAHCHNPHSPRFLPLKPLPPPVRPADLKGPP